MRERLDFFASLTLTQSDIRKIMTHLDEEGYSVGKYLGNILITPLFSTSESIARIRTLHDSHGSKIMFDCGGYYVQTGKLTYSELYYPLLQYYLANQWLIFMPCQTTFLLPMTVLTKFGQRCRRLFALAPCSLPNSRQIFKSAPCQLSRVTHTNK